METVTQINENIDRLTTAYKDIFTTVYVIKTEKGAVLFDAASYDEDAENHIVPHLRKLGISAQELKYIFISHKHTDHAGSLKRLMQAFPDTCILSRSPVLAEEYQEYSVLAPEDGDVFLDVLRVVTIPGHTKDSSALLDTRTKTLITGDCMQLYGIYGSGDWACNISLPVEHFAALEKVRAMDIDQVLTAHDYHPYGYWYRGRGEIEQALDACVAPLLQIRDLIKDNPELDDAAIRQAYNASGKLPTVKVSVVTAMRAAMNEGKI